MSRLRAWVASRKALNTAYEEALWDAFTYHAENVKLREALANALKGAREWKDYAEDRASECVRLASQLERKGAGLP